MNSQVVYDVIVIGGGPAGLAAAYSARQNGAVKVLIIERDRELGGILQQCIHNGFGLHRFKEELTGPSYAQRYIKMIKNQPDIEVMLDTMVLKIIEDKTVVAVNHRQGIIKVKAKSIVLAMGCRERTRGAIRIPGARPAGIFTAGAAQRMVNMEGYLPGKKIVILGSGDIGLIMARRLTLEGAHVAAVLEILPYSNGLTRNIVQCLEDYDIPLYLSHTVIKIHGSDRVSGVTCAKVDDEMNPIPGTEFYIDCDCLLLSVGLIPENELTREMNIDIDVKTGGPVVNQRRETSMPGVFAAGNVVHVHDLVDFVSEEGEIAGKYAALYANGTAGDKNAGVVSVVAGSGIRSVVPQVIARDSGDNVSTMHLFMRAAKPQRQVVLEILNGANVIASKRLPIVKPGEMIVLDLAVGHLADIEKEISVSLRQAVKS